MPQIKTVKRCHFCGLEEGQTVRVPGGGLTVVRIGKVKNGEDMICGWCRLKILQRRWKE